MTRHLIELGHHPDASVSGARCKHNRWHPGIEPAVTIRSGDIVEMATQDALDGQIDPAMTAADLGGLELGRVHPLTGPIAIEGARPGDLLAVHIESVEASDRAFTATFPGRGFLPDLFPGPLLVHWDLADGWATSAQLPGIRIPAAPFMGTIGVAPSLERLRAVNRREQAARAAGALVMPPMSRGALPADPAMYAEAWRTSAAHEVGGNMDIRQLVAGSTVYFPVDVPGALFSAGDAHFTQGDGETCGTAMEMSARFTARFELLEGEARRRGQTEPTFELPPGTSGVIDSGGHYATTGLSVSGEGVVSPLDAGLAARNALVAMVDALVFDYGLSKDQAYILVSVAGELRISSIVNVPHAQVSLLLPKGVFVR